MSSGSPGRAQGEIRTVGLFGNPDKEEFTNDVQANAMRAQPMREPWTL